MGQKAKKTPEDPAWTTADLTRIFGFTPNYVSQLVKQRIVVRNEAGRFGQRETVQAIFKHREETLRAKYAVDGEAKARLAAAKAGMAELALKEREGRIVDTAAATDVIVRLIGRSKQRLLAIPARLAPRIGTARNAVEAEKMISEEIHLALVDLSSTPGLAEEIVAEAMRAS